MEEIFWLHPNHPLTIEAIQNILRQRVTVQYALAPIDNSNPTSFKPVDDAITPFDLLAFAIGLGPEVPAEITRLMLLLVADFFTKNPLATSPLIISRLVEFYQFEILPQVFSQGLYASPTAHLLMPVFGAGKVYFQNYLLKAADVHDIFSWPPVSWPENLPASLVQTSFLGLSGLIYCFLQFKKIFDYSQALFPLKDSLTNTESLFSTQIEQLETQLNEALAYPQNQPRHASGLAFQVEKLLATFGDHIAERFSKPVFEELTAYSLNENIRVFPKHLQTLIESLSRENFIIYEDSFHSNSSSATNLTKQLGIQPYVLLRNLEQIMALATILQAFTVNINPETNLNSLPRLLATYRNQVIDVLKEAVFAELIQKTILFLYASVSRN